MQLPINGWIPISARSLRPALAALKPWQDAVAAAQQAADVGDLHALEAAANALLRQWGGELEAVMDVAAVLVSAGQLTQTEALMQWCHQLAPNDVRPLMALANVWLQTLRQNESLALYQQLPPSSGQLMALSYQPGIAASISREWADRWGQVVRRHQPPLPERLWPKPPENCLRIGWLSGDLCQHPVGLFLLPLVEKLSQEPGVEMIFYDTKPREDWLSEQLRDCGQWRVAAGMSDTAVAELIQNDQLSILIELSGHTASNRLPVLLQRPAPIQWNWLGFWATTGIPEGVDAVVVDPVVVPPGSATAESFSEQLVYLPHSRWCYRPVPWMPELTEPPCLKNSWVTFGCLNSSAKLNPALLACWAELLNRVPDSRLLLKNYQLPDEGLKTQLKEFFQSRGIEPQRLLLQGPSVHSELLAVYAEIDIALDPFPFNGGLTSCEALWMGLPLVALAGEESAAVMAARQAEAILRQIGRSDWVTPCQQDYITLAIELAQNPEELKSIRSTQRFIIQASELCNEEGFAASFLHLARQACTPEKDA
jgi:protein O-GlcNAc transferase